MDKNESPVSACLNCGVEISSKYCPHCGQEKIVARLKVTAIMHDVTHGIFHWDNSILRTFRLLLTEPGYFVKDYINGKRKSFVKPFSFFLFFLTIYVLLYHWLSGRFFSFFTSSFVHTGKLSMIVKIQHLVNTNINYLYFVFPLAVAFILFLFLKKKTGINYAEALVFSFYAFAMILIFSIAVMLLAIIDIRIWNLRPVVIIIYLPYAVMQFSGYAKVKGFVIGGIAVLLSYLIFMISVSILIFVYFVLLGH
jgi:hypothetical protein